MSINKKLLIILAVLVALAIAAFVAISQSEKHQTKVDKKETSPVASDANAQLPSTFLNNIIAQSGAGCSVYYKSLKNNQVFYNYSGKMPAAGIIKVFIMAKAMDDLRAGDYQGTDEYTLDEEDIVEGSPALQDEKAGAKIKFGTLVEKMITADDNTATNMLISILGMDNINKYIQSKGYVDTILVRKMMDYKAQKEGKENYTSVNDLVTIFEKIYWGKCVSSVYDKEMLELLKTEKNKNKLPALLPKKLVLAQLEGDLPGVQNTCGIVYAKEDYVLAIMTDSSIDSPKTLKTINQISSIIYNSVVDKEVFKK